MHSSDGSVAQTLLNQYILCILQNRILQENQDVNAIRKKYPHRSLSVIKFCVNCVHLYFILCSRSKCFKNTILDYLVIQFDVMVLRLDGCLFLLS